jgi:chromosome segregation ATPase
MRYDRRAVSVGRPSQGTGLRIMGTTASDKSSIRSRSTERQIQPQRLDQPQRSPEAVSSNDSDEKSGEKRRSKMEKIRQLQSKNELYKTEFKRVQKDRKLLKKEVEAKNMEIESLTKEIDARLSETSILKLKLSQALQEIHHNQEDQRRDLAMVKSVSRDLSEAKHQLDQALSRVGTLKDDLDDMKAQVKQKDEEIDYFKGEVSNQIKLVQALGVENTRLRQKSTEEEANDDGRLKELQNEKKKLQTELGSTLDRCAAMVKEREDAISDLLKENGEMKQLIGAHDEKATAADQEVLMHLKAEAETANMELEEAQDRIAMLEEEIEGWIVRSGEMEPEIVRLQDEVEAWQRKATAAEEVVAVVEENAKEKATEAAEAQKALAEMETRHRTNIAGFEAKHRSILADAKSKHLSALADAEVKYRATLTEVERRQVTESADDESQGSSRASVSDTSDAHSRQAMHLQMAVAARQSKTAAVDSSGWRGAISGFMKTSEEEELDENQKRIKELEALNADKEDQIMKLKSETVRLSSGYKEIMYVNKKKIEQLTSENEAYVLKTAALVRQLAEARGEVPSTVSNES